VFGAAALVSLAAAPAEAVVLDFSGSICNGGTSCSNYVPIDQSYGDTAFSDVSYRSINVEDSTTFEGFLRYWDDEYGDLIDVLWGGTNNTGYISEIAIDPAPGFEVSLVGFDLAGWPDTDRPSQVTVYRLDFGEILYSSGPVTAPGDGYLNFDLDLAYRADIVRIQWGPDGFTAGLDNIHFEFRPISTEPPASVTDPAMLALTIVGLIGMAKLRRRKATRAPRADRRPPSQAGVESARAERGLAPRRPARSLSTAA
jgi:hypothetical protein